MAVIYAILLCQLFSVLKRLELQTKGLNTFADEKRSVTGQFMAFAACIAAKDAFNFYLIFTNPEELRDEDLFWPQCIWCIVVAVWAGLPFTYSFVQNYISFKDNNRETPETVDGLRSPRLMRRLSH